ncbi:hypothetical protein CKW39_11635 [Kocuria sp. WRN011]|uniref:Uncharacterized protein n=1 Tax=Kocuria carniphila TaxID=262208 RepID=A0ABV3UZC2_9MICC|nr:MULTISPECIES: hypothetical protein [Kocuria]MCT1802136.1 hypothetical protein [Kocuria carniphila]PBB07966.1 hypothetical protein CKW39_11635 [Kocuria sp. WRN011]PZP36373.1 MAG: hypothetical protein DI613_03130 [Kocuria rhizophila]
MTDQQLNRVAVLVHADAPELPFLANLLDASFTAVTRNGWAVVLPDENTDPAFIAAVHPGEMCIAISSDGAERSLTVYSRTDPDRDEEAELNHQIEMGRIATLRWEAEHSDIADILGGEGDSASQPQVSTDVERDTKVAVEAIASICSLDAAATARLENYAATPSSGLLLESVLQLLGVPVVAAKLVESERSVEDMDDAHHYEPKSLGLSLVDAMTTEPSGNDVVSRVQRAYFRHPEILLAVGGAELVAGSTLAALARRGGRGSRVLGTASAVLLADAAGQAALWAAVRARKKS